MLFCFTAIVHATSLERDAENPNTDRRAAVTQMLEAAGGKVIELYGISGNGPGATAIFDAPDPEMAPAISGVAQAEKPKHRRQRRTDAAKASTCHGYGRAGLIDPLSISRQVRKG